MALQDGVVPLVTECSVRVPLSVDAWRQLVQNLTGALPSAELRATFTCLPLKSGERVLHVTSHHVKREQESDWHLELAPAPGPNPPEDVVRVSAQWRGVTALLERLERGWSALGVKTFYAAATYSFDSSTWWPVALAGPPHEPKVPAGFVSAREAVSWERADTTELQTVSLVLQSPTARPVVVGAGPVNLAFAADIFGRIEKRIWDQLISL